MIARCLLRAGSTRMMAVIVAVALGLWVSPAMAGKVALTDADLDQVSAGGLSTIIETGDGSPVDFNDDSQFNLNFDVPEAQIGLRALAIQNVVGELQLLVNLNVLSANANVNSTDQRNFSLQSWGATLPIPGTGIVATVDGVAAAPCQQTGSCTTNGGSGGSVGPITSGPGGVASSAAAAAPGGAGGAGGSSATPTATAGAGAAGAASGGATGGVGGISSPAVGGVGAISSPAVGGVGAISSPATAVGAQGAISSPATGTGAMGATGTGTGTGTNPACGTDCTAVGVGVGVGGTGGAGIATTGAGGAGGSATASTGAGGNGGAATTGNGGNGGAATTGNGGNGGAATTGPGGPGGPGGNATATSGNGGNGGNGGNSTAAAAAAPGGAGGSITAPAGNGAAGGNLTVSGNASTSPGVVAISPTASASGDLIIRTGDGSLVNAVDNSQFNLTFTETHAQSDLAALFISNVVGRSQMALNLNIASSKFTTFPFEANAISGDVTGTIKQVNTGLQFRGTPLIGSTGVTTSNILTINHQNQ